MAGDEEWMGIKVTMNDLSPRKGGQTVCNLTSARLTSFPDFVTVSAYKQIYSFLKISPASDILLNDLLKGFIC